MKRRFPDSLAYAGLILAALLVALAASWTPLGAQLDRYVYDWMYRWHSPEPWEPGSILLAADEESLAALGGIRGYRAALAEALERIAPARPKAVAVDVILADESDPESDRRLEQALEKLPNLVLACDLLGNGRWEDPLPRFRRHAQAVGHIHAQPGDDAVCREIPLEKAAGRDRRWALALEVFRLSRGGPIIESPEGIEAAGVWIPAPHPDSRPLRIRFLPPSAGAFPRVSLKQLRDDPRLAGRFTGRVVFAGVTALSLARDRLAIPYSGGATMPGLEIHAHAFDTLARQMFLPDAPGWWVLAACVLLAAAAGVAFRFLSGGPAYLFGAALVIVAGATPHWFFLQGIVFPFTAPAVTAWAAVLAAGAWQHFGVRRRLGASEAARGRYQQAMHFVTHEMRTPLTAIQGSSELMGRYSLPDEKRRQIAGLIHSESKRLARMIETFLNVERLSAGEMELKRERFPASVVLATCVERVRPLAERKQIRLAVESMGEDELEGDRELMEYAFYNLMTNAVKYSPSGTQVTISASRESGRLRISVRDQGMGMDQKEVRRIFQKFYRTRKAEQSGEAGTGLGLAIVEQIVIGHGGSIEVTSRPGEGSCFAVVLPAPAAKAVEGAR